MWDENAALAWQIRLNDWWRACGHLTREKTLFRNGQFGYTRDRLRKAWLLIRNVVRKDLVFTYVIYGNPRTTSSLQGGVNAGLRDLLRHHRGLSLEHRSRAAEWFLVLREVSLEDALTTSEPTPKSAQPIVQEPDQPALYGTGFDV